MASDGVGARSTAVLATQFAKAQRKMVGRRLPPELIAQLRRKANLARKEIAKRDFAVAVREVAEYRPIRALPRTAGRTSSSRRSTRCSVRKQDDGPEPPPPVGRLILSLGRRA
jgi:hypothetical protein